MTVNDGNDGFAGHVNTVIIVTNRHGEENRWEKAS